MKWDSYALVNLIADVGTNEYCATSSLLFEFVNKSILIMWIGLEYRQVIEVFFRFGFVV